MKNAWPVQRPRHRRPPLSRQRRSTRTSTSIRSSTPTRTAPSSSSPAGIRAARTRSSPATPTAPKARPSSRPPRTPPGRVRTFKGHNVTRADLLWAFPQPEPSPYQLEWDDLIDAIRNNKPYNEVERGAIASLVTSMGRMAAHTGQIIKYDEMLNSDHEFAPDVDKLTRHGLARAAATRRGWQVPGPHARPEEAAGVLRARQGGRACR